VLSWPSKDFYQRFLRKTAEKDVMSSSEKYIKKPLPVGEFDQWPEKRR
jgi:hypothetical protein